MKIAISTINDYNNYGNRLQNFALQEVLKSLGHDVATIRNYHDRNNSKFKMMLKQNGFFVFVKKVKLKQSSKINYDRFINFIDFTKNYIDEIPKPIANPSDKYKQFSDFDGFIIGSDQTWNPNFSRFSSLDFIPYARNNQLVISYAASFGVSEIPREYKEIYKDGLKKLDSISVRERVGIDFVKNLAGKDSEVVLDPTLILSKTNWVKLGNSSKINFPEKYILTYFLDRPNIETNQYIIDYSNIHNCEIISLGDISSKYWSAGPTDFVKLFQHAEAVFTDSFHACAFSIIFEKYFEVFQRNTRVPSMNSRLDTLFTDLGLENRWHGKNITTECINYKTVNLRLERRKKDSLAFLKRSLKLKKTGENL